MLLSIIRYIRGYLRIQIIGYSPERFLNLCSRRNIYLWGLKPYRNNYEMFVSIKGFRKLKPIIRKTKTKVVILNRYGLPFFLHKYRKRKIFFAGVLGCIISVYIMSTFVWNIHIEGNYSRTDEVILEYLETTSVRHGMKKSDIDCAQIAKDIRKHFNDIIWVSASIEGTRLIIQVKENTDTIKEEVSKDQTVTDLIASEEGEVVKIITRTGVPSVSVGDHVKKGDLLVSGRVEIKNDAGEVTEYRYQSADADVYIKTTERYEASLPINYEKKVYTDKKKTQIFIRTPKHLWKLGTVKNSYKNSESYTSQEQLKLGENFYFPLSYGKNVVREYTLKKEKRSERELQEILSGNFAVFCEELEKKGVEIIEKNVKIYKEQETAVAKGDLILIKQAYERIDTEMIQIEDKSQETPEGVN